ncbi:MAG: hypothetical protein AB7O67_03115 [Vicinamibacterales bacterium]
MRNSGSAAARYRMSGLTIASDLALAPLPAAGPAHRRVDWHLTTAPPASREERVTWFRRWFDPDRRLWLRFGRLAAGYRLRFAHSASFDVHPGQRRIVCRRERGTPLRTLRHLFLNQVLPLAAATPERLVLHASAVSGRGGAIVFVGAGGRGKSTLAAAMTAREHRLLTDDALVVEPGKGHMLACPAFPEIRLWPDSARALTRGGGRAERAAHYTTKRRLPGPGPAFEARRRPISRIYLLDRSARAGAGVSVTPVTPRDAVPHLVRTAFVLDTGDRRLMRGTFELISSLVAVTPVFRLRYPDALARLDEVVQAVTAHRP